MGALLQGCGRICWHQRAIQAKAVDVLEHSEEETSRRDVGPSLHASETSWGSSAYEKLALFPDFGGSSPQCPPPPKRQTSGPITLDVLQGDWYAGNGSQISVSGTAVYLNGLEMRAHRVELDEDGSVVSIGRLWQVHGWGHDGAVEFRAASSRENMEFAPKEVWTRRDAAEPWLERMRLMGYAGTAADPLNRGVEGCIPGTLAQDMPSSNDAADVELLSALIIQWREPGLQPVRSCHVIPDFVNREGTGVGVELVHFIALSMKEHGFKKRRGKEGHDIPVVVREPSASAFYEEALLAWREKAAADEGFPPVRVSAGEEMFTSLGNGHFFQALNLYDCQCNMINCEGKYVVGEDANLAEAIAWGVPSIVLHHNTPRTVRAKIAHLLNAKREYHWALQEDGTVDLTRPPEEDLSYCKQFECMSKFLDAVQVNSLVRTHLGIRDSKRAQGLRRELEHEEFLMDVAAWAWEHCVKFPHEPPTRWEHPLEFTKLHNEYRQLFEGKVDEYLEDEGVDMKAILDDVVGELRENPGPARSLVDSLTASEDYLGFCRYMQQIRERREWAEGKGLGVLPETPESTDAGAAPARRGTLEGVPEESEAPE